MNKKLYVILFLGFLAISFYPYNKSNFVISANKKLVNDTVKALTKEDIMGEYSIRAGYGHHNLRLFKDTFRLSYGGCTFSMKEQGQWYYKGNLLSLFIVYKDSLNNIYDTLRYRKYTLIHQDAFLICLEIGADLEENYKDICRLHNAGLNATHSTFLHKKLENHTPVPIPTIPIEYHKFLLRKPITCQVTAIENDTVITINVGKEDGLFEGLQLYKKAEFEKEKKQRQKKRKQHEEDEEENSNPLFLTFEVVSCQNNTATLKPIADLNFGFFIVEKAKKLQIGNSLCSKREKKTL